MAFSITPHYDSAHRVWSQSADPPFPGSAPVSQAEPLNINIWYIEVRSEIALLLVTCIPVQPGAWLGNWWLNRLPNQLCVGEEGTVACYPAGWKMRPVKVWMNLLRANSHRAGLAEELRSTKVSYCAFLLSYTQWRIQIGVVLLPAWQTMIAGLEGVQLNWSCPWLVS